MVARAPKVAMSWFDTGIDSSRKRQWPALGSLRFQLSPVGAKVFDVQRTGSQSRNVYPVEHRLKCSKSHSKMLESLLLDLVRRIDGNRWICQMLVHQPVARRAA